MISEVQEGTLVLAQDFDQTVAALTIGATIIMSAFLICWIQTDKLLSRRVPNCRKSLVVACVSTFRETKL